MEEVVTASVRSSTPSLARMLLTNHLAVPLVIASTSAISPFVHPLAISFNTSTSREVRPVPGARSEIRLATSGGILRSPAWTARIAATS